MRLTKIDELLREDGTLRTYAGIGGYSLTFLNEQDGVVCGDCASKAVAGDHNWLSRDNIAGAFIYWEGSALSCDECGDMIESEYGDVDSDD